MRLTYVAHDTGPGGTGVNPLPEGWPAEDHDEPDAVIAKAKVASGRYERAPRGAAGSNGGGGSGSNGGAGGRVTVTEVQEGRSGP